jgi:hypothetical protein
MKLEAKHMHGNVYAVRPEGCLGVAGWINGKPWTVAYIKASSPAEAIRKAK